MPAGPKFRRFAAAAEWREGAQGSSMGRVTRRSLMSGGVVLAETLRQRIAAARVDPRQVYEETTVPIEQDLRRFLGDELSARDRAELKKKIKKEGSEWVAKYAKGGAVKGSESAKSYYIAIDAVIGFIQSDSPKPTKKFSNKVISKLDEGRSLLEIGK
uniref:Uncharacterized protein n=1 Tax=Lotharella globosa TaxID=91324 RepID=A0A7S3ZG87_9EUKA|mmetsp:Transcript_36716/g.70790  ORF Transcript_36716/g.70790 Transcript_36716/m.70790 type:complete len:158 (+) Transcript_36716:1-474(+)